MPHVVASVPGHLSAAPGNNARRAWSEAYRTVRAETERRAAHLSAEDQIVQSMADASPAKWHRAHTTWFFETFLLKAHAVGYREFDDQVRAGQRQWLQDERDACRGDRRCLDRAYDRRIDALLKTFDANAALTFGRALN